MKILLELSQQEAEAVFAVTRAFAIESAQKQEIAAPYVVEQPQVQQQLPIPQPQAMAPEAAPVYQNSVVPIQPEVYAYQAPQPQPVYQQTPVQQQPVAYEQQQQPQAVPTGVQTYTSEQLAVAATQLVDMGRRQELIGLLASFGVNALIQLPKEHYGTFATQLRAMGAKL